MGDIQTLRMTENKLVDVGATLVNTMINAYGKFFLEGVYNNGIVNVEQ